MIPTPDYFDQGYRVRSRPWFDWLPGMLGLRSEERVNADGDAPYFEHGDGWNEDVPDLRDRATSALLADLAAKAEGEPDRFLFTTGGHRARFGTMPFRPVAPPAAHKRPGTDPVPGREGTGPVPSPPLLARLAALGDGRTPVGIYWHPDAAAAEDPACDLAGPGWAVEVADSTFHGRTAEDAIRRAEEHARC